MPSVCSICSSSCNTSKVFLLSSVFAVVFAYVLEYFFNMLPCKLCIYERVVYYFAGSFAAVHMIRKNRILVYAMFSSYFIGAIMSFYHVGIELHLFHDILGCVEKSKSGVSVEELGSNLLNPNYSPPCNKPNYILGISITEWNLIYLVITLLVSIKIYFGEKKKSE